MIPRSTGNGVGIETDKERNHTKDIIISKSLLWAAEVQLTRDNWKSAEYIQSLSSRAKDIREYLSTNSCPPLVEGYFWGN